MKFRIFNTSRWLPCVTSIRPPPTGTLLLELGRHTPRLGPLHESFPLPGMLFLPRMAHPPLTLLNGPHGEAFPKGPAQNNPCGHSVHTPCFPDLLALNMACGLPQWLSSEESACSARDVGRSLGREDPPKEEIATHSSILVCKNPTDRGAWRATVHGVAKSCS